MSASAIGEAIGIAFLLVFLIGILVLACLGTTVLLSLLYGLRLPVVSDRIRAFGGPTYRLVVFSGSVVTISCGVVAWLFWVSLFLSLRSNESRLTALVLDHPAEFVTVVVINTLPILVGGFVFRTLQRESGTSL